MEKTQVGPFKILSKLGTNRRQQVYRALQIEQQKEVALKFISIPPNVLRATALEKIDREVKFLQKLRHPNLCRLYGAGVEEDKIFFASELVQGESLAAVLARRGRLAVDLVVDYASQICDLLQYIHQHELLHSKLTPDKILIGNDGKVKVSDLRINRSRKKRWDAVASRRELDVAAYMAPEQLNEGATEKSDLYSLGVITYEMLTGKLPYTPDTMGRMNNRKIKEPVPSAAKVIMNCPMWLDQIVSQMLQPDPRSRPHTSKAVGLAFDEIKKIDRNKKAAIDQVSGGFNPLTVGQDKSEAQRLLGEKRSKQKQTPEMAFYQRIPFLVISLIFTICLFTYALWPASPQKLYDKAVKLVDSDEPSDWASGRVLLKKVANYDNVELKRQAEHQILRARRKALINQAKVGKKTALQSEHVQDFIDAYHLEITESKLEESLVAYKSILDELIVGDLEDGHIGIEVKSRIDRLQNYIDLPANKEELNLLLTSITKLTTEEELLEARKKLDAINQRFGENLQYKDVVDRANALIPQLDKFVEKLRSQASKAQNSESNNSQGQDTSSETTPPNADKEDASKPSA